MRKSEIRMMKFIVLTTGLFFICFGAQAQNETRYTLYTFNKLSINPAYAGGEEVFTLSGHYRDQWTGLEGAPRTFTLSAHTPLMGHKVGAGLTITADKIGIANVYNSTLSYAYRIKVDEDRTLSIGLSGHVQYSRTAWESTRPLHEGDSAIPEMEKSKVSPNFGVGIYYQTKKYYLGGSVPRIFSTTAYDDLKVNYKGVENLRSYYFMAGFVHRISGNVKFQPGLLLSYIPNAPFEMDASVNFVFHDRMMVGVSYRLQNSINTMVQVRVSEQMKIAAAIDVTISDLRQYTPGSFEIMLEYQMIKMSDRTPNLRYFF